MAVRAIRGATQVDADDRELVLDEDVHQGRLGVMLPDGREQTAFLVWTTWPGSWDETNLHRPRIPPPFPEGY